MYTMAEVDTHHVTLTGLSGAGISRLRNGHPCRCALGAKGEGVGAHLGEDNIKKLLKAGKKGAKATIKLAKHEIEKNRMEGSGIMAGGKIKIGKTLKKVVTSKPAKSLIKSGIEAGAAEYLGPEAAPIAGAMTDAALGGKIKVGKIAKKIAGNKTVQKVAKEAGKKALKEGIKYATSSSEGGKIKVGKIAKKIAGNKTVQKVAKEAGKKAVKEGIKYATSSSEGEGLYAGRGMYAGRGIHGGSIGPHSRVTNVGAGGDLLGPRNPALRQQASAANWFFHTQFPPALADDITGGGLYAGRGLYA